MDKEYAEWLGEQWKHVAPVEISGPAYGIESGEFTPGMYIKKGYTITSRGCPNKCWFCKAWKREGSHKELTIHPGNDLLDDNILACSDSHIRKVFAMLEKRPRVKFTGGLEAARLKKWHVEELKKIKPDEMFFAYDEPRDWEPLVNAAKMLQDAGFGRHPMRVYVLAGFPKDTLEAAETRLRAAYNLGFIPMIMVYLDESGLFNPKWKPMKKLWTRPAIIKTRMKKLLEPRE